MKRFLALLVCLPLLGSCGTTGVSGGIATAEKGLITAHVAYDALGKTLISAAQSGLLKGADAAQAKVYYDKAGDALLIADKADQAADAAGLVLALQNAEAAISDVSKLVKGK